MDEVDSAVVHPGQAAKVTVDSHPGETFPGHVVRVAPYVVDIESQNRTVEIEVELDDPEVAAKLLPGTSADVEVILEVREDALRIPTSAILQGSRVLVPEDGELVEREIQTGLRNWDYVEVTGGLAEGELVVVSLDREEVKAGAKVRVEEEPATR
jgi:HlyD family secretion protein